MNNPLQANIQQRMMEMRRGRTQTNLQESPPHRGYQIPRQPGAGDGPVRGGYQNAVQGQYQNVLDRYQQQQTGSRLDAMAHAMQGQIPQGQAQTQPATKADPNHMKLSMKQAYLNAHHQGQPQPSPGMPSTGSVPSPEVNWQPSPNDSPMNAGNTYDTFQDAINAARGEINDAQQGGFADDMTRIKGALPPGMNIHPMEQFDPSTDPNRMKLDMKQTYLNNQFQDNLGQHQEGSPGHLNTFFQNAIRHGIDPNLISQFINHRVGVGIPRQPIKKK